jgi:ketosteroid isomerase-like protein
MSQENVDVLRRMNAAFNRHDWDGWLSLLDPDVVYYDDASLAIDTPTVVRGLEQALMTMQSFVADLENFRHEIIELVDDGDRIFCMQRWTGTGRSSGVPLELLEPVIYTLRDGLIVEGRVFRDRDSALEALGRSE